MHEGLNKESSYIRQFMGLQNIRHCPERVDAYVSAVSGSESTDRIDVDVGDDMIGLAKPESRLGRRLLSL